MLCFDTASVGDDLEFSLYYEQLNLSVIRCAFFITFVISCSLHLAVYLQMTIGVSETLVVSKLFIQINLHL